MEWDGKWSKLWENKIQGNNINITLLYIVNNTQIFQQPFDEIIFLREQVPAPEYFSEF